MLCIDFLKASSTVCVMPISTFLPAAQVSLLHSTSMRPRRGRAQGVVQVWAWAAQPQMTFRGQTCGTMNEASQGRSFYMNTLSTCQLPESFLPTLKNICLLSLFLKQQLSWFFSCTLWRVNTRNIYFLFVCFFTSTLRKTDWPEFLEIAINACSQCQGK